MRSGGCFGKTVFRSPIPNAICVFAPICGGERGRGVVSRALRVAESRQRAEALSVIEKAMARTIEQRTMRKDANLTADDDRHLRSCWRHLPDRDPSFNY
jgi:hypothetical protein